jgi:hypothetical protein
MKNDQWKVIPDYEDYYVSSNGEVKSYRQNIKGRILKPKVLKKNNGRGEDNYLAVYLYDAYGKGKMFTVHSLVMRAFVGERPVNMDIDHIKNHKQINKLSNLRYVPKKTNVQKEQADHILCRHISGKEFICLGTRDAEKQTGIYRVKIMRMLAGKNSHPEWRFKIIKKHQR